ncbi:MAG: deoxyribose-phosphate aldolase [Legionella sp.]|nr:deoxyribose-phosphate aldolase [Legionella sp.]
MNLKEKFMLYLADLTKKDCQLLHSNELALSLIDLTLLNQNATDNELILLQNKAITHQVAAICVYPEHLAKFQSLTACKHATVVNFPQGNEPIKPLLFAIETIINNYHPDEIDYVFPYEHYLGGEKERALKHCREAYLLCQRYSKTFKVILETGVFPTPETIYQLGREIIDNGCDFLKTSTGKVPSGVTPTAAFSLLKAIKDSGSNCGIKVSGGIKKPAQAFLYMELAHHVLNKKVDSSWFRIGASSLLDELINKTHNNTHPDY